MSLCPVAEKIPSQQTRQNSTQGLALILWTHLKPHLGTLPEKDDQNKEKAEENVADVAPHIIECTEEPHRMGTLEVVVASILIAALVKNLQTEIICMSNIINILVESRKLHI